MEITKVVCGGNAVETRRHDGNYEGWLICCVVIQLLQTCNDTNFRLLLDVFKYVARCLNIYYIYMECIDCVMWL